MKRAVFVALLAVCFIISSLASSTDEERRKVLLDLISDGKTSTEDFYNSLRYNITPMDRDGDLYKQLSQYFVATQILKPIGNSDGRDDGAKYELFSVTDVFTLTERNLATSSNIGNKMLLWHGSPLRQWKGILTNGFQIPKGTTSSNFGAGGYFADSSSKACFYCSSSDAAEPRGVTMLAEVALGGVEELVKRDTTYGPNKLPAGKNSVKARGKWTPDPSTFWNMGDVLVPSGKLMKTSQKNRLFNEYVVYSTDQIKMRYLVTVELINSSPLLLASIPMLAFSSGFIILIHAIGYY